MMQESILHEGSRLFAPGYRQIESNDQALLIDPEAPHWVITDRRGARILGDLDGKKTFGQVVADYCRAFQVDWAKGWLHCHTFLQNALRTGFVAPTPLVRAPYKHLCDGEDLEQTGLISGWFFGEDPFFEFHERGIVETLFSLAETRCRQKPPSGYDRPMIYAAMGEATLKEVREGGAQAIGGFEVALSRSTGVLSADLDRSRRVVSDFYGEAAKTPQPQLCCPGGYPEEALSHIPREALEIAYGCGSPVDLAGIQPGETVVDLGSGGGIDCFIAAKKVGATGRVIGIDMTDAMLAKANRSKSAVAKNLGYDVVEFKKGYLEEIPLPAQFADLITSNCVINLSPDKNRVFVEMWRVLKDFGRIVLSDTVAEQPLPPRMKANPRLWGECISGALTEAEYLSRLEEAGFYGLAVIKKSFWKEVEGYRFHSVVIRGYKYEKKRECNTIGQKAIYLGPMQAVIDEEGHLFPRNQAIEVCTDTAAKLKQSPMPDHLS